MLKIVLDTNFCLIPFQFKIDIFAELQRIIDEEFRVMIPFACIEELRTQKLGMAAIDLIEMNNVFVVDAPLAKSVDEKVLKLALKEFALIATQDKELKKKAKKAGIPVITLRQKKRLVIED